MEAGQTIDEAPVKETNTIETEKKTKEASKTLTRRVWDEARKSSLFWIGGILIVSLVSTAIIWPEFSEFSATKINVRNKYLPPLFFEGFDWSHPLGTDYLGRDIFLRCLIGLKISLFISVTSVVGFFFVGCFIGLWSGFKGKLTDTLLMRLTDIQLAIPPILVVVAILGVSRPTPLKIILVFILAGWAVYARVARSIALAERQKEYVRASQVLGASDLRTVILLIATNVLPSFAFVAVLDVARMMIFEALIGFLGLGVQPPTPSFGSMIADGRKYIMNAWWICSMPGAFLLLVLLGLNLAGTAFERARDRVFGGLA